MKKPNPTIREIIADVHAASPYAAPTSDVRQRARKERSEWLDAGELPVVEPDPAKREVVPILDDPDAFAREFFTRQSEKLPDPPMPKPKKPKRTKPTLIVSNDDERNIPVKDE